MSFLEFHIITISTYGYGLSGGDRIFIELTKRFSKRYPVSIYVWEEGYNICIREGVNKKNLILWSVKTTAKFGFFINYFARIIIALFKASRLKLINSPQTIIYSASEFWQDSLPALILKIRFPKIKWIAAWYMTAPNPFKGFKEEGKQSLLPNLRALAYWTVQQPIRPLIQRFADMVFITSEPDRKQFLKQDKSDKVIVIKGGVDLDKVKNFQLHDKHLPKIYDAVFQGRFHPQKGVLELIDIWKAVVKKIPSAKLAMIGDGPLMEDVTLKIKSEKLGDNIELFGYVFDGPEKYRIFSQSKIVVHPAVYDSGGMAAAEAMAFGLPGMSFDLEALKTYYPLGMVKVPFGDFGKFSDEILHLLGDHSYYRKVRFEALALIKNYWSWDKTAIRLMENIETLD